MLPLLITERVRRATQLTEALTTNLETHELTSETAGIDELSRAISQLSQHLARLVRDRNPQ